MPVAPPGLRWHEEVDIGIVGAGGCGLVAAHAAARADLKILIWDKSKVAGGTTALSCGMVPGAGTRMQRAAGIFETGEDLARDVLQRNRGRSDPLLIRRLCDSSAALVEWLADSRRIPLELVTHSGDPGHTQARLHAPPSRSGQALIDGLLRAHEHRSIRVRLSTPVIGLWLAADGATLGVQVKTPKKSPTNIRCGKVILATDGFGGDPELLRQHCPGAVGLTYIGAPSSSGDALRWGIDAGASALALGAYEAQATVAVGSGLLVPWDLIAHGAMLVNQRGERFADETRGPSALVADVLAQPGHVAYEIFDARVQQLVTAGNPHFATAIMPRALRRADDVAGLAKQFQIAPDALAHSVATHHATMPLVSPLYGIRVGAALLQTQGGLAIDFEARVKRPDGTVIPHLYAGGGAAVGISGTDSDGYLSGNGLLCALGWGKIAGEQAAQELLAARPTPTTAPPAPEGEPAH